MDSSMSLKLACVVVLCMVVGSPLTEAAVTCGAVTTNLAPCVAYLRGTGAGAVPGGCCTGIKALNAAAQTTADRQAACNCLKTAAGTISGINYGLAGALPGKCGVNIPYKISPSTDCKSVK